MAFLDMRYTHWVMLLLLMQGTRELVYIRGMCDMTSVGGTTGVVTDRACFAILLMLGCSYVVV